MCALSAQDRFFTFNSWLTFIHVHSSFHGIDTILIYLDTLAVTSNSMCSLFNPKQCDQFFKHCLMASSSWQLVSCLSDDEPEVGNQCLPALTGLSDDDGESHKPIPAKTMPEQVLNHPQKRKHASLDAGRDLRQRLAGTLLSVCRCARVRKRGSMFSCYTPFRGSLEELIKLRHFLQKLHKQDMDNQAR